MQTLNELYSSLSVRRRYEVWFIRLGLADGSGAWWFRYLLMNPGRRGCAGDPRGMPAASLVEPGPAGIGLLRSDVVVATAAVRGLLGPRLGSVYAPAVIASFGSGDQRIDIRVVARGGAAVYLSALRQDMLARRESGVSLLRTRRIEVSAASRAQLVGGQVDARLLVAMADLAAVAPVSVVTFGAPAPGASQGMPLRSAELAAAGHGAGNAASLRLMAGVLRGQHGVYRALYIQTVRLPGGRAALRVDFAAPSPLGLLNPQAA